MKFEPFMTKAELIELALIHLPSRKYIVDKVTSKCNTEIVRLPVRQGVLNPIEFGWADLKNYVRKHNVRFSFNDIAQLCSEWLAARDSEHVAGYLSHLYKNEMFKVADKNSEVLENNLVDSDDDIGDDGLNDDDETND